MDTAMCANAHDAEGTGQHSRARGGKAREFATRRFRAHRREAGINSTREQRRDFSTWYRLRLSGGAAGTKDQQDTKDK